MSFPSPSPTIRYSYKKTVRLFYILLLFSPLYSCLSESHSIVDPNLIESIRWYTGESGTVDDKKAKQLLELAATDKDPLSTMWMARVYSTGRMGFPTDKPRAQVIASSVIEQIEAIADSGVDEAQFLMGTAYAEALGKDRNDKLAAEWYRRAADNGHVLAAHNMGNSHFSGTGVSQDDAMAVFWWTQAALAGDAIVQYRLGQMYEQGRGVEINIETARSWYQDSSRRGNSNALNALEQLDI